MMIWRTMNRSALARLLVRLARRPVAGAKGKGR